MAHIHVTGGSSPPPRTNFSVAIRFVEDGNFLEEISP